MDALTFSAGAAAALGILGFALRRKLRRDAIYQGGVRVGSALPPLVAPDGRQARFVIIRGEPGFQEGKPFVNRGMAFRIISAGNYDDRSTVLRRWLDVTCEVVGPGQPGAPMPYASARDHLLPVPVTPREGIPEMWIVDLDAGIVEVCRHPGPDGYGIIETAGPGGTLQVAAPPGIELSIDRVLD